ncbi:MAG: putative HNHc nuclease [Sporomusaceae bacterium]|nr:putative HNHc nuclease [Sporomusaceae bacterium]
MEIARGKITDIDANGITIYLPYQNVDRAILRQYSEVQVGLPDGRTISPDQRRKAYALMHEIGEWMGELPEFVKRLMKIEFVTTRLQSLQKQIFSLSDCDVTTAREFITFLIDFMVEHEVPSRTPLYELCEDINKYVYACLMRKVCCVCGQKADLHHFDAIGMGRDRDQIYQIGMRVISLCREHHTAAHTKGQSWLIDDLHLVPIALTAEIGKKYKLTKKNLSMA